MFFGKVKHYSPPVDVYRPVGEMAPLYISPEVVGFVDGIAPDTDVFEPCAVDVGNNAFDVIEGYSADSLLRQSLGILKVVFPETSPYISPSTGKGSVITIGVKKGDPPVDTSTGAFDPRILHRDHLIGRYSFYGAIVVGKPTVYFAGHYFEKRRRDLPPAYVFVGEPEIITHEADENGHLPFIKQNAFTLHQRPADRTSDEAFISVVATFR